MCLLKAESLVHVFLFFGSVCDRSRFIATCQAATRPVLGLLLPDGDFLKSKNGVCLFLGSLSPLVQRRWV